MKQSVIIYSRCITREPSGNPILGEHTLDAAAVDHRKLGIIPFPNYVQYLPQKTCRSDDLHLSRKALSDGIQPGDRPENSLQLLNSTLGWYRAQIVGTFRMSDVVAQISQCMQ